MSKFNSILEEAQAELDAEEHIRLVKAKVQELRNRSNTPWYVRLFPWRLKIINLMDNK